MSNCSIRVPKGAALNGPPCVHLKETNMSSTTFRKQHRTQGYQVLIAALAFTALAAMIAGCQPKPIDEKTQNINTFQHQLKQMNEARAQVGKTMTALDEFCNKPGNEPYKLFVEQIQEVQRLAYGIRDTSITMNEQGDAYFANWDDELAAMSNTDLRSRSATQKADVQRAYHEIAAKAPAVRGAYDKFMTDLEQLRTYFDRDKTAAGISAASTLISAAQTDGAELQRQLDQESANLQHVHDLFVAMKNGQATK
jgi:hypothetical protein